MIRYTIIALVTCFVIGCGEHNPEFSGLAEHGIGIFRDGTLTESTKYHGRFQEYYSKIKLEDWPLDVKGISLVYEFDTGANGAMDWGGLTRLTVWYTDKKEESFEIRDDENFETWLETLRAEHVAAGQPATPSCVDLIP